MQILINASNLEGTGADIVVRNTVPAMAALRQDASFLLLLPDTKREWLVGLPENVRIRYIQRTRPHEIGRLTDLYWTISAICRKSNVDVCFTVGDLGPITTSVPHIIFMHHPYIVADADITSVLSVTERVKLWYSRHHFRVSARRAQAIIVQTPVMARRVQRFTGINSDRIFVVPSTLPEHVSSARLEAATPEPRIVSSAKQVKLLFLATYYAHKGHAMLPTLIATLDRRGLSGKVHFFLTLDGDRRAEEAAILNQLAGRTDIVTNLGRLTPSEVAGALKAVDALFLPTLSETFGLIYLEARAAGAGVLTSDRDFARWICGEDALYFEPRNPNSMADAIERFLCESRGRGEPQSQCNLALNSCSGSWTDVARAYLQILEACDQRRTGEERAGQTA